MPKEWKTWRRITLGQNNKTGHDFMRAIALGPDQYVSDEAIEVLHRPEFTTHSEKMEVDLVVVSVAELDFPKNLKVTHADIFRRAQELGLELCPAEVGPELRIEYMEQSPFDVLTIAITPIVTGANSYVFVVYVNQHGEQYLGANISHPTTTATTGSDQWVFMRPQHKK